MSNNALIHVNRFFKDLYYLNQRWFRTRNQITPSEEEELYKIAIEMWDSITKINRILKKYDPKRTGGVHPQYD